MNKPELIATLKQIKRTKIFQNYIPDYETGYFLFDNSTDRNNFDSNLFTEYSSEEWLENQLFFRFDFKAFDSFISTDSLEFFVRPETTATREESYNSLADKILSLNSVFTPVIMNKIFEAVKYAAFRDKLKEQNENL